MDTIYLVILIVAAYFLLKRNRGSRKSAAIFRDRRGYLRFSDSGRSVHRWVAAKKLGRALWRGAVVHHINRDKTDNRPGNLWVFGSQKSHDRAHKTDARKFGKRGSYRGFED